MKFVEVDKVPGRRSNNNLQVFLREFYTQNIKVTRVDFKEGEYKSPVVAARVMSIAAKKSCLPIQVTQRKSEVYLIRTDM